VHIADLVEGRWCVHDGMGEDTAPYDSVHFCSRLPRRHEDAPPDE
jgi:hypothetical protein